MIGYKIFNRVKIIFNINILKYFKNIKKLILNKNKI